MTGTPGIHPDRHVVVRASAGTGKTWLLVSRIVRLLYEGVAPGAILAITFTRKAAAEIDQRVGERLFALADLGDTPLDAALAQLGIAPGAEARRRVRGLYEGLLTAEHPLRASTFHAFCAELLRRFPVEAEVPAGFELVETTGALAADAWLALEREAAGRPDGELAAALDTLLRAGGVHGLHDALDSFLAHRSDWWARTENLRDPVAELGRALAEALGIDAGADDPVDWVEVPALAPRLERYTALLTRHPTATHLERIERLRAAQELASRNPRAGAEALCAALLSDGGKGAPYVLKANKTLATRLGAADAQALVALHAEITDRLVAARERFRRRNTWALSAAWYRAGRRLLEHFQRIKHERGILDFADLEWQAYRLLNRSRHAEWVQYKLDQRIEHLLVDEFQDTNPTQWRLLLPLLAEIAAGDAGRGRSVFLVGDEKQSIYRFRRADPALFAHAETWLASALDVERFGHHVSRRSSPAIARFVNRVFGEPAALIAGFPAHDTHRHELWGRAELLPLVAAPPEAGAPAAAGLRDPLETPRAVDEDRRYAEEGARIAEHILALRGTPILDEQGVRPLAYGDVFVLLRDRTHAAHYEAALRHAGIPYQGAGRGTLLDCLEVRDLVQLLTALVAPADDLALAGALRAPLFAADSADLVALARDAQGGPWSQRLEHIAAARPADDGLARGARLIGAWRGAVDRVPVHDLLDRIYDEGDVIPRYLSAAPAHLRARIAANLGRFLELALELDSGRYPSLSRFLAHLETLAGQRNEAPSEPPSLSRDRVQLLTVHGVKGLEAPVVFLADAARPRHGDTGMRALVSWPVEAAAPRHFHLVSAGDDVDEYSRALLAEHEAAAARENMNLLYVALTRSKQYLFVSGCEPARGSDRGWYGIIEARLRDAAGRAEFEVRHADDATRAVNHYGGTAFGTPPPYSAPPAAASDPGPPDPALTRPLPDTATGGFLRPSAGGVAADAAPTTPVDARGAARGLVLHRMLERLTTGGAPRASLRRTLRAELGADIPAGDFDACFDEARALIDDPRFRDWFDPKRYRNAHNELPILFRAGEREVYGVIDRLVVSDAGIAVLDYKTHAGIGAAGARQIAAQYREQLQLYMAGAAELWPAQQVRGWLIFTAPRVALELRGAETGSAEFHATAPD